MTAWKQMGENLESVPENSSRKTEILSRDSHSCKKTVHVAKVMSNFAVRENTVVSKIER